MGGVWLDLILKFARELERDIQGGTHVVLCARVSGGGGVVARMRKHVYIRKYINTYIHTYIHIRTETHAETHQIYECTCHLCLYALTVYACIYVWHVNDVPKRGLAILCIMHVDYLSKYSRAASRLHNLQRTRALFI